MGFETPSFEQPPKEKGPDNIDWVEKTENIQPSENILPEKGQPEYLDGDITHHQDVIKNIESLPKSIEEHKMNEDSSDLLTEKERLGKLQAEVKVPDGQKESELDESQAIMERSLDTGTDGTDFDSRIVDYFRNYLGPEETLRRFNNMGQDSQRNLVKKIKAGEVEEVVNLMEDFTLNMSDRINELRDAFGGLPEDKSEWKDWEQRTLSAESNFNNRGSKIRYIINRLNQDHNR